MSNLISRIYSFIGLNKGSERAKMVKRNALASLIIKLGSMFIDFAKVPVLLTYLLQENYGVFLTITSIVAWTHRFDFGLGAGLRYKLTAAISQRDNYYGKRLVSTAYISLSVIMLIAFIIISPIITQLNWNHILNSQSNTSSELMTCVILVIVVFFIQFVLELISIVLQANQRAAVSTIFKPIANLFTLLSIIIIRHYSFNSLYIACLTMTLPIVVVLFFANVYLFTKQYKSIAPSLKDFDKKCIKDIYSLGLKYFIGSVSSLIIFNTASFLITYFINPKATTIYNTAWTYFGIVVLLNTMVLQPLVAAITDAYIKDDISWIKNCFIKICRYSLLLTFISLIMLAFSQIAFHLWVGDKIIIPWGLSIAMTVFFIGNIWSSPFQNFLTGVGKQNVMVALSCIKILIFIPVSIVFIKSWGLIGLVSSILLVNTIPNILVGILQFNLIINKKAKGIWDR